MGRLLDAVKRRVAHVEVGMAHVDLGAQHARAVGKFARPHATEEIQILGHRAVAKGAVLSRFVEVAAVLADLLSRQVVDIGLAIFDQDLGKPVDFVEVVRGIERLTVPAEAQPGHVLLDGLDVLDVFGAGVGVVVAQVALAAILGRQAEVQADGFGVADMQVAVWLGRKAGVHAPLVLSLREIIVDDLLDEGAGGCWAAVRVGHERKTTVIARQCPIEQREPEPWIGGKRCSWR